MTGLADLLRTHIDYTIWATDRLMEASEKLDLQQRHQDFGTADKSVYGTLTHLMRSERAWFQRIQEAAPSSLPADQQWETLQREWPQIHRNWRDWVTPLSDADAQLPLAYTDLKGTPWVQPIWQIVLHVVNHSTHHRGQVSGFLRSMGHTPPPLDFIAFVRSLGV